MGFAAREIPLKGCPPLFARIWRNGRTAIFDRATNAANSRWVFDPIGTISCRFGFSLEPVINLQEQHMLPECSKPAQNALPVRCDAECIYCFLLNSGCLVKSAMIPLGLRVQS